MVRTPVVPPELAAAPFRAADAIAAGLLTRRQLAGPAWRHLLPGIYAHADLPLNLATWCRAAGLLAGTRGAVSGLAAAHLLGAYVTPAGSPVEITIPRRGRLRPPAEVAVVRSGLTAADVVRIGGIPVTSPVRTAFDLARRCPLIDAVIGVDALRHARLVNAGQVRAYTAARANWPGSRRVRIVLALSDAKAESPMETYTRLIMLWGRLPRPVSQYVIRDPSGYFVARADFAFPEHKLAIEYDGDHHRDRATFRRDLTRQNALQSCGWTILRFTATDILRNPHKVVATIRDALDACGRVDT